MSSIESVAVGFDGSPDSMAALRWAAALSANLNARLTIIHAVGLLEHAGLSDRLLAHRETAIAIAVDAGLEETRVDWLVLDGDPCSALLRATSPPHSVGLLVVGTRGSGRHGGTILGSTSLELAENAQVPVTIVPREAGST